MNKRRTYTPPTATVVHIETETMLPTSSLPPTPTPLTPGRYDDLDPDNVPIDVRPGSEFDPESGHGHSGSGHGNRSKQWGSWGYWLDDY